MGEVHASASRGYGAAPRRAVLGPIQEPDRRFEILSRPSISNRVVTFSGDVAGAGFYRLDFGNDYAGGTIYFPIGTTSLTVATAPSGFSDAWNASQVRLSTFSLSQPAGSEAPTYDSVVQFDGVDLDDFSGVTEAFSRRTVVAP